MLLLFFFVGRVCVSLVGRLLRESAQRAVYDQGDRTNDSPPSIPSSATENQNITRPPTTHPTDPPLADMVDEQLAALYEGSVARLAASGRSVRLELEKVRKGLTV